MGEERSRRGGGRWGTEAIGNWQIFDLLLNISQGSHELLRTEVTLTASQASSSSSEVHSTAGGLYEAVFLAGAAAVVRARRAGVARRTYT